jgi:hypothetical protein
VKRVFSSHNLQLVHHRKNLLEAAGIRAIVRNEFLSSAMGELPPAETQAELWIVNDADLARAQEALYARFADSDWVCSCGETLGGQFTQCWRCGAYRPAER